jgi:hypothetical protein
MKVDQWQPTIQNIGRITIFFLNLKRQSIFGIAEFGLLQ